MPTENSVKRQTKDTSQPGVIVHRFVDDEVPAQLYIDIEAEAERRIIALWVPAKKGQTLTNALMYQQNVSRANANDPRFAKTDAIREASNSFEAALTYMPAEELAALVVREWDGVACN